MLQAPIRRAFVLHSGGVDSTTCLMIAKRDYDEVTAVSINYGQRHIREIESAALICHELEIPRKEIHISSIFQSAGEPAMLLDPSAPLPKASYDELGIGISPTYVPFRNGTLLSILSVVGSSLTNELPDVGQGNEVGLFFGAHAEDAHNWAYPDCTPEFIGAMSQAIFIGTYQRCRLIAPLQWDSKAEVIQKGMLTTEGCNGITVDPWDIYSLTWSCYAGEKYHCGQCPTCRARHHAFMDELGRDPTPGYDNPAWSEGE